MSNPCPPWLRERLAAAGGRVPFRTYMQWALHDPEHGAYGAGRLRIGPGGDFATAPSLGPDFAALLLPQLAQWLEALAADPANAHVLGLMVEAQAATGLAADARSTLTRAIAVAPGNPELAGLDRRLKKAGA